MKNKITDLLNFKDEKEARKLLKEINEFDNKIRSLLESENPTISVAVMAIAQTLVHILDHHKNKGHDEMKQLEVFDTWFHKELKNRLGIYMREINE